MKRHLHNMLLLATLLLVACGGYVGAQTPLQVQPLSVASPQRVVLLFAGDLMQHMPQVESARRGSGFDYHDVFQYVEDRFQAADLAVINLETTLSPTPDYSGYPLFRSPVQLVEALARVGVDVAVLANNHCCDGGRRGVQTTIEELKRHGIHHTGLFTDTLDRQLHNPLLLKKNGVRFALLNYTYSTNGMPVPAGVLVNTIDTLSMKQDLAAVDRSQVDCIIVCIHWGTEYERGESTAQRDLAAFLRREGVSIIVGSHPHVVQPFEQDSTQVTLYSLGNFVSNQRRRYCDGGLLAEITVEKRVDGGMRYQLTTTPIWVLCPGYRILPPTVGDTLTMPDGARRAYDEFQRDTRQLLFP